MKTTALFLALLLFLSSSGGLGQEKVASEPEKREANPEAVKAKDNSLKSSSRSLILIQFPNDSVESVLSFYERLIGKEVEKDASLAEGPKIALVTPHNVSIDAAISLVESALLVNGYVVEETEAGEVTVRFDASRQGEWILGSVVEVVPTAEPTDAPAEDKETPSGESIRQYKELSEGNKQDLRDFITKSMKENPSMTRGQRAKLILEHMNKLSEPKEEGDGE